MGHDSKTVIGSAVNQRSNHPSTRAPRPSPIAYGPDDAPNSEQTIRYIFLSSLMYGAGMTGPEVKQCLAKYVRALSKTSRGMLEKHIPNANDIMDSEEIHDAEPVIPWLSKLAHDNNLPADQITACMGKARARLLRKPEWFYGPNGWFLWTAANLCRTRVHETAKIGNRIKRTSHLVDTFWLDWVGPATLSKYRNAWYTMFGMEQAVNVSEAKPFINDHVTPEDTESIRKVELAIKSVTSKYLDQELAAPIEPSEVYFNVADPKPLSIADFRNRWLDADFLALVAKTSEMVKSQQKPQVPASRPVEVPAPLPTKKPEPKRFISPGGKITFPQVRRPAPLQKK
ncbi:hypothetical protein B0T19DRAFT_404808 [Cercophora scortea]|uniref:Uncharacterized protein n=1 Tax=Cercophora scortea TaxID=314031 RepID=A0AAE0I816_9PEZI|nr:hypothetical protein B0T19DRAFT_404808 [Cercophora scortea]